MVSSPRSLRSVWLTCALLLAAPAIASAQQPSTLPPTVASGGVSIGEELYDYVASQILVQNADRHYLDHHQPFVGIVELVDEGFGSIVDALGLAAAESFEEAFAIFCVAFPTICTNPWTLTFIAALTLVCGVELPSVFLFTADALPASARGSFSLGTLSFDSQLERHVIDLTLRDVGLMFVTDVEVSLGQNCNLYETRECSAFVFKELDYRVVVDLSSIPPVVTASLLTPLGSAPFKLEIGSLSIDDEFVFQAVDFVENALGVSLFAGPIAAWAATEVPLRLQGIFARFWLPYLPFPGGLLDLRPIAQSASLAENWGAGSPAAVSGLTYTSLGTNADGSRVRARFHQTHDAIPADPQATLAVVDFVPSSATVDFDYELDDGMGTFYIDRAAIQHSSKGGVLRAVGKRSPDKDSGANDIYVNVPMYLLAPEHQGLAIGTLLDQDPLDPSPILPVPISAAQAADLAAMPVPVGPPPAVLGDLGLHALEFEIEIDEIERDYNLFPFDQFGSQGTNYAVVTSEVRLQVRLVAQGLPCLEESFQALFQSHVRLAHDRQSNSHRLQGVQTFLITLLNGNGLDWFAVVGDTSPEPAAGQAPVSFLMRAIFGLRAAVADQPDDHFLYLVEGLAGPLVERSLQGFVRLPGLDFPQYTSPAFGTNNQTANYFSCLLHGWKVSIDRLCARYGRWGSRPGMDAQGQPEGQKLAIEVDWTPVGPVQPVNVKTNLSVTAHSSSIPVQHPSIHDAGYLKIEYRPQAPADEARVMNASGFRTGPYLRDGGTHYVAATPIAYSMLRQNPLIALDPTASIEFVPYRQLAPDRTTDCPASAENPAAHPTGHDEGTEFEVWTFESRPSCFEGKCDNRRLGIYWGAALYQVCGPMVAVANHDHENLIAPCRQGPDDYQLQIESCPPGLGGGLTVTID